MNLLLPEELPRYDANMLAAAIRDVIYWQTHQPITSRDRLASDEAFVRLRQGSARLEMALKAAA